MFVNVVYFIHQHLNETYITICSIGIFDRRRVDDFRCKIISFLQRTNMIGRNKTSYRKKLILVTKEECEEKDTKCRYHKVFNLNIPRLMLVPYGNVKIRIEDQIIIELITIDTSVLIEDFLIWNDPESKDLEIKFLAQIEDTRLKREEDRKIQNEKLRIEYSQALFKEVVETKERPQELKKPIYDTTPDLLSENITDGVFLTELYNEDLTTEDSSLLLCTINTEIVDDKKKLKKEHL